MVSHIKIHKSADIWTVRAGGAVLAESTSALVVVEGDADSVVYFPREDIAMAFLDETDMTSHNPNLGEASYFSVVTKSRTLENVVWSYKEPKEVAAQLRDHLAFHNVEEITVEKI